MAAAVAVAALSFITPINYTARRTNIVPRRILFSTVESPSLGLGCRKFRIITLSGAKMTGVEVESSLAIKKKAAEIIEDLKGTSIFLVGMKCTMKTSIGKLLADALRYYYFDSDNILEQAAGVESSAKSFREENEKGFQESQSEVLKQLSSMGRLVVCAGDGAVQTSTNLALLRHGISIWLDVPLDSVANEILARDASSSIKHVKSDFDGYSQVLEELLDQYNELKGGYATADATVSLQKVASYLGYEDLAGVTEEDMTLEILKEIEKLTRVKKMMAEAARPF